MICFPDLESICCRESGCSHELDFVATCEGTELLLSGSESQACGIDSSQLLLEWDLDNDGIFEIVDASTVRHTFASPGLSSIGLRASLLAETSITAELRVGLRVRLAEGCRAFIRGDANVDSRVDVSDPVAILNFLFLGTSSLRCLDAADVDGDGRLSQFVGAAELFCEYFGPGDIRCVHRAPDGPIPESDLELTDAIYLLNHLFLGGPPPAFPYPDCGVVPVLGCKASPKNCD